MRTLKINLTVEDEKTKEILIVTGDLSVLRDLMNGVKIHLPKTSDDEPDLELVEAIAECFNIDVANVGLWTSTNMITDVLEKTGKFTKTQLDPRKIYKALKEYGINPPQLRRLGESVIRGYWGISPK